MRADVNAVSDTGSTPLRSACLLSYFDIVKLLVENGADIHKYNENGSTPLMNSIQSVKLCNYLLNLGASVNEQDVFSKTALYYAIQEGKLETVKLLLNFNANPFLVTKDGDDALQTACLFTEEEIFDFLKSHYSLDRVASAYELMGCIHTSPRTKISGPGSWFTPGFFPGVGYP